MNKKINDIVTIILTPILIVVYAWVLFSVDIYALQTSSRHYIDNILAVALITLILGLPLYGMIIAFIEFIRDDFLK